MRKITLSVAFLLMGGIYMANAQVGIGTPTPATSSMLDVEATDKGVLIPRVKLTSTDVFAPVTGTEVSSLLVYNTAKAGAGATAVTPGFYYWIKADATATPAVVARWERIVDQSQLDEIIKGLDLDNILELLTHVYPSNNLDGVAVGDDTLGGGMVFTPGDSGATPATVDRIEYVYYDATAPSGYKRVDMTDIITGIVQEAESKTLILQTTDKSKQFYVAEKYLQDQAALPVGNRDVLNAALATSWATGLADSPAVPLPDGVYEIDIVNGVINNIEQIFTTTSTIVINEGSADEITFTTVEEYIQYIAQSAETVTFIRKAGGTPANPGATPPTASTPDKYYYFSEAAIKTWKAIAGNEAKDPMSLTDGMLNIDGTEIDVLGDVANNFEFLLNQNTSYGDQTTITIKQIIEQLAREVGGNVNYTGVAIPIGAGDSADQLAIPANSFYYIVKGSDDKDVRVRFTLGNELVQNTAVKTKDTFGGKAIYIYNATTTMVENTANTLGVDLPTLPTGTTMGKILSVRVIGPNGTATVTELSVSAAKIDFKMGSGNMYTVLPAKNGGVDIVYDVIIEFAEN